MVSPSIVQPPCFDAGAVGGGGGGGCDWPDPPGHCAGRCTPHAPQAGLAAAPALSFGCHCPFVSTAVACTLRRSPVRAARALSYACLRHGRPAWGGRCIQRGLPVGSVSP